MQKDVLANAKTGASIVEVCYYFHQHLDLCIVSYMPLIAAQIPGHLVMDTDAAALQYFTPSAFSPSHQHPKLSCQHDWPSFRSEAIRVQCQGRTAALHSGVQSQRYCLLCNLLCLCGYRCVQMCTGVCIYKGM